MKWGRKKKKKKRGEGKGEGEKGKKADLAILFGARITKYHVAAMYFTKELMTS